MTVLKSNLLPVKTKLKANFTSPEDVLHFLLIYHIFCGRAGDVFVMNGGEKLNGKRKILPLFALQLNKISLRMKISYFKR